MKRIVMLVMAVVVLAAATTARARTARTAAGATKVEVRQTGLGKVLVNRRGFTLYAFTADSRNHDKCLSKSGCSGIWPLLKTHAKPVAGPGVKRSLLGSIAVPGGRQVTYAGHPLYTYSGDGGPGETDYVGFDEFGGHWYAINASGKFVK